MLENMNYSQPQKYKAKKVRIKWEFISKPSSIVLLPLVRT